MKKQYSIITLMLSLFSLGAFAQYGEISNGGFESWTNQILYETPTDWQSSNTDEFRGVPMVSKSTTAQSGTYSVKLETAEFDGDTLFGYVYHGGTGQNGPDSGIPYSASFDTVSVYCQSNITVGDTLFMIMMRYMGGSQVDEVIAKVAVGVNSSWTQVKVAVNTIAQDSLFIGFIIGNPLGETTPAPSSWALVDNVEMMSGGSTTTALPNQGFETWGTGTTENPDDWYTVNEMLSGMQLENANKTTDANSGTYAIELTTIQAFGSDTIGGFLSMGVIDFNSNGSPFLPTPYTATPTTFSGAYKYSSVNGDTEAGIQIEFMQGGNVIGNHIEMFTEQSTYTSFSSTLTITGTPDSVLFVASSGGNPGSILKLDDLQFSGGDVSVNEVVSNELFSMYPNPANDMVTLNVESNNSYSFYVYNVIGKLVYSNENMISSTLLNVSNYPKGTYLIRIVSGNKMFTEKLIVE